MNSEERIPRRWFARASAGLRDALTAGRGKSLNGGNRMDVFAPDYGFSREALGVLSVPGSDSFAYNDKHLNRLNARERVILRPIVEQLRGARVLDLGSHDGRWCWAVLKYGAAHATGIEWRQEAIDFGMPLFRGMEGRYTAIQGNVYDVIQSFAPGSFDVILNLGLFYHVMDHHRLLRLMRDLRPKLMVLDGALIDSDKPFVHLETEDTRHIMNTAPDTEGSQQDNVVGVVSRGGFELMCRSLGLQMQYMPWNLDDHPNKALIADYFGVSQRGKKRFTIQLTHK
jgi:hypothetical protein